LNTYKSLILSYSADYRRIFSKKISFYLEKTNYLCHRKRETGLLERLILVACFRKE